MCEELGADRCEFEALTSKLCAGEKSPENSQNLLFALQLNMQNCRANSFAGIFLA
jgi:hypothetical protein